MSEIIDRVSYEMQRFELEYHLDGTFFIQDGYTGNIIREGLTAADEPLDIVAGMNARAAIKTMREPTESMVEAADIDHDRCDGKTDLDDVWRTMIDECLK